VLHTYMTLVTWGLSIDTDFSDKYVFTKRVIRIVCVGADMVQGRKWVTLQLARNMNTQEHRKGRACKKCKMVTLRDRIKNDPPFRVLRWWISRKCVKLCVWGSFSELLWVVIEKLWGHREGNVSSDTWGYPNLGECHRLPGVYKTLSRPAER
jgi:hypothetical protein